MAIKTEHMSELEEVKLYRQRATWQVYLCKNTWLQFSWANHVSKTALSTFNLGIQHDRDIA